MKNSVLALLGLVVVFTSGCKEENKLIDHVTFKPSDNLEVVRVSVVFTKNVKSDLAGGFSLKEYGYLFVNPYTPTQPFEMGFDLNTAIVNDQDYIRLEPTTVLPNGVPIGIDYALVEVHGASPINDKFDLFAYVDVLKTSWLGAATIFSFLTDKYFPAGLTVSEILWRDHDGYAGIIGSIFGPKVRSDGSLERAGGIALFANVRKLIEEHKLKKGIATTFYPEKGSFLTGPAAPHYEKNGKALEKLKQGFIESLNPSN